MQPGGDGQLQLDIRRIEEEIGQLGRPLVMLARLGLQMGLQAGQGGQPRRGLWQRGRTADDQINSLTQGVERLLLDAFILRMLQPELFVMLPVAQPLADRRHAFNIFTRDQCLQCQRFAKASQPIATLGLGLGAEAQPAELGEALGQCKQRRGIAGFELQFQFVDGGAALTADYLSLNPGQLNLGVLEGDQPVATQEVGAKLGDQLLLDVVALGQGRPNLIGKGREGRQIAADGGVVLGSGVQAAHYLTAAFDGLFGEGIAAADPQPHLQLAQGKGRRIEIDVAELLSGRFLNFERIQQVG